MINTAQEFAELLGHILHGLESECYAVQKMWEARRMYDDELESALTLFEVVRDMQERVSSSREGRGVCISVGVW